MADDAPRTRTIPLEDDVEAHAAPTGPDPFERDDRPRTPTFKKLERQLTDVYVQGGLVLSIAGEDFGGKLIARRADLLAGSWVDLAENDPKVKRGLDRFLAGSGWSAVIISHAMIALPIAAARGLLPAPIAEKVLMGMLMQDPEFMGPYMQGVATGQNGNGNG